MATQVIWTADAREDVEQIAEYIRQNSESAAKSVVKKLVASTRNLELFPKMGRRVPEFDDEDMRELIVFSYRVVIACGGVTHWSLA